MSKLEFEDFECVGSPMAEYITRDWAAGPLEADWAVYDAHWEGYEGGDGLLVCCRDGKLIGFSLFYHEDPDLDIRWGDHNIIDVEDEFYDSSHYPHVVAYAKEKLRENLQKNL